ncbi:MAG: hypothetical protein EA419_05175 [Wenzhouxiangella sp.]|nr:MAG: hypothetical protein EA419_05175 [Wenzhouxiangella sp.]
MMRRRLRRAGFHLLRHTARLTALVGGGAALRRIGETLGAWHYRLDGKKRRQLTRQLARVLGPRPAASADLGEILREAYRINDRAIFEILALYSGSISAEQTAGACRVSGLEALDRALDRGRGVVLLGMHMGNGVALAVHLVTAGYPVHVVYRESNKITPDFFRDGIERQGLKAIPAQPAAAGVRKMLAALKANQVIFILMDQASKTGGVPVDFLHKRLHMPPGPVEMARRTGACVVPAWLVGVDRHWHFRLSEPILMNNERGLAEEVKILVDMMQAHILAHPQWWSWHQRRWSRHPFKPESPPADASPKLHR